jgi:glycosyltransferase involved in cell wall biosynthesis
MHYAVPALLQRAGMLERLYTDCCASIGPLRYARRLWPAGLQPKAVRRLLGRVLPPDIPDAKVRQVPATTVADQFRRWAGRAPRTSQALMKLARDERFGGANAIYTVLINEDLELCAEAKKHGCFVVHEAMMSPDIGLWLDEEYKKFPMIPRRLPPLSQIESWRDRDRRKYQLADLILAPSEFVRRAVLDLGAAPEQVKLVPYGVDESWLRDTPNPIAGRVLFVGSVGLLKGSHYLAEASRLLARRGFCVDIKVVGPCDPNVNHIPLFQGPRYVGQVPRSEIKREFLAADVFVLPTIAEGSAVVTYEALACGIPVITTPNCGSVVRDGIDGFIIPIRNAEALADAIERVVSDRTLRTTLSANARERAKEFTWARYGERLIDALSSLESAKAS